MATAMIGTSGLALIKASEGVRTTAYADPVRIPTVCYGHTGPEVRVGQKVPIEQCEVLLMTDIVAHQKVLLPGSPSNCIGDAPLNQNQIDALTSFTFNVGTSRFCKSTMARKLRARDYRGAAAEFPKWTKANQGGRTVTLPGLVRRRVAERELFEAPVPPRPAPASTGLRSSFASLFN